MISRWGTWNFSRFFFQQFHSLCLFLYGINPAVRSHTCHFHRNRTRSRTNVIDDRIFRKPQFGQRYGPDLFLGHGNFIPQESFVINAVGDNPVFLIVNQKHHT